MAWNIPSETGYDRIDELVDYLKRFPNSKAAPALREELEALCDAEMVDIDELLSVSAEEEYWKKYSLEEENYDKYGEKGYIENYRNSGNR